ncbi:DUF1194 domain-containing protein [Rhodoplanes roseus]|uniref:VWFA domain-containing protein n=1 Tax=Rhodoplanes roseus TaxID=29409 RepID=A0A327KY14_9BRAD|nr:DUF1194 domain-containing protein [Rhodoplanes roseus]RAI42957.1 hypothetical protein CH341_16800 [Rhodoplanes roseus]
MRTGTWAAAAVVAAAGIAGFTAVGAGAGPGPAPALRFADLPKSQADSTVDVEIVLAVDISYSMDPEEQALQREGYVAALGSPEFLGALKQGMHGKIVVTYVEWAGAADQRVLVPWRVIDGPASAEAFAASIAEAPYRRAYRTSISGALQFSADLFKDSGQRGIRRVIDVSGDGANNQGALVDATRDEVIAKGITINGLPLVLKRPNAATMDIEALDVYYEDCVIGGPSAFMIPIRDRTQFKEATRTKLVLEIAGRTPELRVIPAAASQPRISCTIGERMWQQRWGRDFN